MSGVPIGEKNEHKLFNDVSSAFLAPVLPSASVSVLHVLQLQLQMMNSVNFAELKLQMNQLFYMKLQSFRHKTDENMLLTCRLVDFG